jgi:hypothetical protein
MAAMKVIRDDLVLRDRRLQRSKEQPSFHNREAEIADRCRFNRTPKPYQSNAVRTPLALHVHRPSHFHVRLLWDKEIGA